MKHALLFFTFALLANLPAQAQYFSKVIDIEELSNTGWQLFLEGETLVLLSATICERNPNRSCAVLVRTDLQGEVLHYNKIEHYRAPTQNSLIKGDSTDFYLALQPSPLGQSNATIVRLDSSLSVQESWDIGEDDEMARIFSIQPYLDGFVAAIYIQDGWPDDAIWIKFLDGDMATKRDIYYWRLDSGYGLVAAHDLRVTTEGDLVGSTNSGSLLQMEAYITKFDSLGQVKWQAVYPQPPNTTLPNPLVRIALLQDGNVAANWITYHVSPDIWIGRSPVTIFGLSGVDGSELWSFPFLYHATSDPILQTLRTADNGDIIGMGAIERPTGWEAGGVPQYGYVGWAFRLSPQGQLKWQRFIYDDRSPFTWQFLYDFRELPNGDIVFIGDYDGTLPGQGPPEVNPSIWLVRTDSTGCLVPDCSDLQIVTADGVITAAEPPPALPDAPHWSVFPNPTTDFWTVTWQGGPRAELQLLDLQGRLLRQQPITQGQNRVDAQGLPPGMYLLRLSSEEGVNSRKVVKAGAK
jgi:hypothetical protein